MPLVEVHNADVCAGDQTVLSCVNLTLDAGQSLAIMGPSGSGKTSVLHAIAGIRPVRSGQVLFDGVDLGRARRSERDRLRLSRMGLVFQFGELLPELTALENAALPGRYLGIRGDQARDQAHRWLRALGVDELADSHPDAMSGGQVQRVALARAVAHGPSLLLGDEPTGMLDATTSQEVADLLFTTLVQEGIALIVVTHDPAVAAQADQTARLENGKLLLS